MENENGFWSKVKSGFAYGLGGGAGARIGWSLSGWLIGIVGWIFRWLLIIVVGGWGSIQVAELLVEIGPSANKQAVVKQQR